MKRLLVFFFVCFISLFSFAGERELFEKTHKEITQDISYVTLGNPKGNYIIITFFDYRCTWSRQFHKRLLTLIESGKIPNVRWIPIEAPVLGTNISLSEYILAAKKQGKYKKLFIEATKQGIKSQEELKPLAQKLKIDFDQLERDSKEQEIQDILIKNLDRHEVYDKREGVVPFVIFNKKLNAGSLTDEQIEDIIKESNRPIYSPKK